MSKEKLLNTLKGHLIVSCQALEDEPLHSSFIMSKMSLAAKMGGAVAIRANGVEDIEAIGQEVDLPIIGIIKKEYSDSLVYITPTIKEIDALASTKVNIIAMDATLRSRPQDESLEGIVAYAKEKYPSILLMADCSTVEEVIHANALGFDIVATTLVGYTQQSQGDSITQDDCKLLKKIVEANEHAFLVAEGNISSPEQAKDVLKYGADAVVVGGMISRPQLITKKFVEAL